MKKYNLDHFQKTDWTFLLLKKNKIIYRSKKERLQPLIFCLKNKKALLKGATVYDKIVGRAAALLMIYGKIKSVSTPIISRSALKEFGKTNIKVEYGATTGRIMNKKGDDTCPMEKLSQNKKPGQFFLIMMEK
jgi:hypothetical protein